MHSPKSWIAATFAVLFLTACGSTGIGDVLGGGSGSGTGTGAGNGAYELRGTVDSVDANGQSVYLTNVSGYTSMLSNGGSGGSAVRVYFDNQTAVDYRGQTYRPQDLERGDEVSVRVSESGNRLMASSMTVTHDVSSGTSSLPPPSQTYGAPVRGTVRYIDETRRTIELDRSNGGSVILDFENSTPVYYNNQSYRISDLERGDEVEIRVRDLGGNRWIAQDVTVVRSMSDSGTWNNGNSSSSTRSTIRGTVASVDRSRRTFQLQGTSWISGFNSNAGGTLGTITVQFDDNTSVDVNGALQPIHGLERGDIVDVQVSTSGSTYFAERVFLVRDVKNR